MSYPEFFLRGLSSTTWISDGIVTAAAFQFDENHVKDGWMQQSICWEDDNSVTDMMLGQKKKDTGNVQFPGGLARVPRQCVNRINTSPQTKGLMSYERESLPQNQYHGNLHLAMAAKKPQRTLVSAVLAAEVSQWLPR